MANKTALSNRKQSGGMFAIEDQSITTGARWFVHSGTGTDGAGYGQNPDSPTATLDYAIGLAAASQGDIIYVMPGHNETITAATSCVIDKIGLTIIGLGRGSNRPTFDFDNVSGSIEMDAAACRLSNVILNASIDDIVVAINVDAHDCEIDNCLFNWEETGDEFITTINISAFDRTHIHDCVFDTEEASAGATDAITLTDANDTIIEGNVFRGFWSGGCIFGETTLSARLIIKDNIIYNSNTGNYGAIDMGALSSTGIVTGNVITSLYSQAAAVAKVVTKADFVWSNNWFGDTISERCTALSPATSAT